MNRNLTPKPRLWIAAALLVCASLTVPAQAHGRWSVELDLAVPLLVGAVALSLPLGAVNVRHRSVGYWHSGGVWYQPWGPRWVVVAPPVGIVVPIGGTRTEPEPPPAIAQTPSRPDPVVYPRNGQDAQQTEADRQACDRWATTQPAALAEAAVFQRAVEACMDGRGYTLK